MTMKKKEYRSTMKLDRDRSGAKLRGRRSGKSLGVNFADCRNHQPEKGGIVTQKKRAGPWERGQP